MNKRIKEILNDFKKNKRIIIRTIVVLSLALMGICIYDLILNYDNSVIDKYVSFLSKRNEEFVQIEKNVDNEFSFIYSLDDKDKKNIESKLKKLNYVGMNVYRIGRLHLASSKIISYEQVYDLLKINSNYKDLYTPYTFNSNYLDIPTDSQSISFCINRIGNHFDIKAVLVNRTTLVDTTSNTGNEGERNNTSNINNTP